MNISKIEELAKNAKYHESQVNMCKRQIAQLEHDLNEAEFQLQLAKKNLLTYIGEIKNV